MTGPVKDWEFWYNESVKRGAINFKLKEQNKRLRDELENALYFVKYSVNEPDKQRIMQESIERVLRGE